MGESRWLTTYKAVAYCQDQGHGVDTADIRRACAVGAIPGAELHEVAPPNAAGRRREVWFIPRMALKAWLEVGMPGRHGYQAEAIRSGEQQIPERLQRVRDYGACPQCEGDYRLGRVDHWTADADGKHVRIRYVPALVCVQCGEPSFRGDVAERLEELARAAGGVAAQHQVVEYSGPMDRLEEHGGRHLAEIP